MLLFYIIQVKGHELRAAGCEARVKCSVYKKAATGQQLAFFISSKSAASHCPLCE